MPVVMDLKFDNADGTFDKARQWYTLYNGDSDCLANPVMKTDGIDSWLEIEIAERPYVQPVPVTKFFEAKNQRMLVDPIRALNTNIPNAGTPTEFYNKSRVMDLVSIPNDPNNPNPNPIAYCFDPDPSKRGRYRWSGSEWKPHNSTETLPAPAIVEKLYPDKNHSEKVLEIILGSWFQNRLVPYFQSSIQPHPGSTRNEVGLLPLLRQILLSMTGAMPRSLLTCDA